jgi:pimeloyl-ACP methyl ester carboxylesterase
MRVTIVGVALCALAMECGSAFTAEEARSAAAAAEPVQAPSDQGAGWYGAYQRGSRLIPLPGGRSLNLYCLGKGSPTVVLEPGIGETAFTWWKVQDRIARLTRICAYDRAGMGKSPPGPLPRDTAAEVADLEALLKAGGIGPPYILVGHSMGGYNARLFASLHTPDIAGIVLIDPSVENQIPILEAASPTIAKNDKNSLGFILHCADPSLAAAEFNAHCIRGAPATFPPGLAAKFAAAQTPAHYEAFVSEFDSFLHRDSEEVIAHRHSFGSTPLIVLTPGDLSSDLPPDEAQTEHKIWTEMHDQVAALSTVGSNRVVQGSGHYIHLDKPELVVDAIRKVVAEGRKDHPGRRATR